jgi:spore maturation protein CgeB
MGINLHVPFQLASPTEINERAYNIAACGTPQLTDHPALLRQRLPLESVYAAETPSEYARLFSQILSEPEEARDKALVAMEHVLTHHTVVHRADSFIEFLLDLTE